MNMSETQIFLELFSLANFKCHNSEKKTRVSNCNKIRPSKLWLMKRKGIHCEKSPYKQSFSIFLQQQL